MAYAELPADIGSFRDATGRASRSNRSENAIRGEPWPRTKSSKCGQRGEPAILTDNFSAHRL